MAELPAAPPHNTPETTSSNAVVRLERATAEEAPAVGTMPAVAVGVSIGKPEEASPSRTQSKQHGTTASSVTTQVAEAKETSGGPPAAKKPKVEATAQEAPTIRMTPAVAASVKPEEASPSVTRSKHHGTTTLAVTTQGAEEEGNSGGPPAAKKPKVEATAQEALTLRMTPAVAAGVGVKPEEASPSATRSKQDGTTTSAVATQGAEEKGTLGGPPAAKKPKVEATAQEAPTIVGVKPEEASPSATRSKQDETTAAGSVAAAQGEEDGTSSGGGPPAANNKRPKVEPPPERKERRQQQQQRLDEDEIVKMQVLVSSFSEEQMNRYEMFRRSTFPKAAIKRLIQSITGSSVSQNVVIAMSGISKVFAGEIVEEALDVCEKWGETPPLQPKHMREAVRRMKGRERIPNTKYKNVLFR